MIRIAIELCLVVGLGVYLVWLTRRDAEYIERRKDKRRRMENLFPSQ